MAGLLAKHRFGMVATWEDFCGNARQTSVWNGSNWGGIYAVMLGSQGDVRGLFVCGRICIYLHGPLYWSPYKSMWKDKTQRSKMVIPTVISYWINFIYDST